MLLGLIACGEKATQPKPHAYPRVYYPQKKYQKFDTVAPFSFLYPTYARIVEHEDYLSGLNPYWYNLNYLPFNATLHLSYKEFKDRGEFDKLFEDTRKLAYKHDIKAEEIDQIDVHNTTTNTTGIIYELKGNTATNLNFYISDGKKHFLRGALYFNAKTEIDSIQPVFEFLKYDIIKMIETTKWKD
jgi:gliding motility-associated lipoprotein GldD